MLVLFFFMGTEAFRLQHRTQKPHKNKDAVWLQRTWNKALESYGSLLCYFYVLCPFWSLHALVSIHCYCLDQQGKHPSAFLLLRESHRFGMTGRWENNDIFHIFKCTIGISVSISVFFCVFFLLLLLFYLWSQRCIDLTWHIMLTLYLHLYECMRIFRFNIRLISWTVYRQTYIIISIVL